MEVKFCNGKMELVHILARLKKVPFAMREKFTMDAMVHPFSVQFSNDFFGVL